VTVVCPLCTTTHDGGIRCPECNVDPAYGPGRPSPFANGTLWVMMGGIAVIYVVTLIVVAIVG
jgi:hypothetical protein